LVGHALSPVMLVSAGPAHCINVRPPARLYFNATYTSAVVSQRVCCMRHSPIDSLTSQRLDRRTNLERRQGMDDETREQLRMAIGLALVFVPRSTRRRWCEKPTGICGPAQDEIASAIMARLGADSFEIKAVPRPLGNANPFCWP